MRFCGIVLLAVCGWTQTAATAERHVALSFDVYGAGLHVLHVDLAATIEGAGYTATADIASQGLTDLMLRWRSRMQSTGRLTDGHARPTEHRREGEWRLNQRRTRLTYAEDGSVDVEVVPPPEEDDRPPVPPAQRRNTADLLSALVPALVDERAANCRFTTDAGATTSRWNRWRRRTCRRPSMACSRAGRCAAPSG